MGRANQNSAAVGRQGVMVIRRGATGMEATEVNSQAVQEFLHPEAAIERQVCEGTLKVRQASEEDLRVLDEASTRRKRSVARDLQ